MNLILPGLLLLSWTSSLSSLSSSASSWNLLDFIALIIVASSVVSGIVAGFARSGIGLLCAILGVLCGFWFYSIPAAMVHALGVSNRMATNLIGFLIIFFPFMMAGAVGGSMVMRLFRRTGLGWLDRLCGGLFGFVRGGLVCVAFVAVILAFTSRPIPNWLVNSKVLPYSVTASDTLSNIAPDELKIAFQTSLRDIRDLWEQELQKSRERVEQMKANTQKRKKDRSR